MAKRTYKKQPKPPNTKYSWEVYREKALDLYHNKGLKKNKIIAQLGTPVWDGEEWFVEFSKKDPEKFTKVRAHKKAKLLETRESREIFVDKDVEDWAKRLDKEGKWPKGKSLAQFEAVEKGLQTKLFKEIARLKALGIDASDGHIVALANANITNTPLEKIGQGGSHSPRARIPELLSENIDRGKKPQLYDLPKDVLRNAGIPTTSAEAFAQYLTGDQGTGVRLTTKDKQRIHIKGENPDAVIAQRHDYVEGKKIDAANKKLLQAQEVAEKFKVAKLAKKGTRLIVGGIGTAFVATNLTGRVHAAVKEPSAKNLGLAGLATVDAALEAAEYATGGLALPITTLLQAGIIGAETVIEDGTAKISTANRRRYRHGNR